MDKDKLYSLSSSLKRYKSSCSYSKVSSVAQRFDSAAGELGYLVDNLNRIKHLNQSLKEVIEQPLSAHCRLAHWRNNVLVLAVDSSMWANRLRFEKLELLNKLRKSGFSSINSIEIIIQPDDF